MTSLTHTARTILRSRVRRHAGAASPLAGRKVSDLSNADLLQVAMLLALDVPTAKECEAYDAAKAASDAYPVDAADAYAQINGLGGAGFTIAIRNPVTTIADAEAVKADDADMTPAEAPDPAETPAQEDPAAKRAERVRGFVRDLKVAILDGDFSAIETKLGTLFDAADKPAVIKTITAIDPSKIKGQVPQIIGRKTAQEAGIQTMHVNATRTALDVYDAADAPAVDPNYVWPDETGPALAQMARGRNVMFYGPAGTGKTTFAKQVAAHFGRPFVRISCDDQTEASTLVGMTVPDGAGGVKWQDGQLAAAIRRPGTIILVDEPSVARPGALFVLQAVMDADRSLHVAETGEVIPVAPGVLIVLADNTNGTGDTSGAYEATRRMNRATLDRLGVTVRLDYLTPDREAAVLRDATGCDRKVASTLATFAKATREGADAGTVSHGIGLRRLMALAELITDGVTPAMAFQLSCLETAPYDDREPLRQMWLAQFPGAAS
jgi:MoxR-like ATPase